MRRLKLLRWAMGLGLFLSLAAIRLAVAGNCDPWIAKIVSVEGSVEVQKDGETGWRPVALDDTLCIGDKLRVGSMSRAAVLLPNETVFRLDQLTTVAFNEPEREGSSLLRLLKGLAYFFTRSPHGLQVDTPFVNAAVGGTEFLVRTDDGSTMVSVFEGTVTATNAAGSLLLGAGESAVAVRGGPPLSQIVVHPRDAVQWAIYYPPMLTEREWEAAAQAGPASSPAIRNALEAYHGRDVPGAIQALKSAPADGLDPWAMVLRASLLLAVGRVEAAQADLEEALRVDPTIAQAHALEAVVAVARNRKEEAQTHSQRAIALRQDSPAILIARSYVQQADFDLEGATATLARAVKQDPDNALARARLAELQLSVGRLNRGLENARRAVDLDPELSRGHLMVGFAQLFRIKLTEAKRSFRKAIELDQGDPLARLGLGLAKIREGDLRGGRQEIEIAVVLDPDNALVRSYLGKAYFDEKRSRRASDQYALAKQLDPKDPTPWLYDAVRKRTENRPGEALTDIQHSIRLNDNRAVFRSRLMLDQDLAARSVNLARIYDDLGFTQAALAEGFKSVTANPADFSAHRFLSDAYASQPRTEIGRVSELLQSQLLQPLNINPIPPRLAEGKLLSFEGTSPADPSFAEYNALFNRNRVALVLGGVAGSRGLGGEEIIHSGLYDWFSYSLGQLHLQSDGFRKNNDQETNLYNAFFQASLTPQTSIQGEYRFRRTEGGDIPILFDPDQFFALMRSEQKTEYFRLGAHHALSPGSHLLASVIRGDFTDNQHDLTSAFPPFGDIFLQSDAHGKGVLAEGQFLHSAERFRLTTGFGHFTGEDRNRFSVDFPFPFDAFDGVTEVDTDIRHTNAYAYGLIQFPTTVTWTLGLSGDFFESGPSHTDQLNPKLGLLWTPLPDTTLRAAAFRTLKRTLLNASTLEPTQVAGFNQFFDDVPGTRAWRYGAALDQKFGSTLFAGVEYSQRDLQVPASSASLEEQRADWEETLLRSYVYWIPYPQLAVNAEYRFERYSRDVSAGRENLWHLDTHRVPLGVGFFHPSGFFARLKTTYVHQSGEFPGTLQEPRVTGADHFWVFDGSLGYRLPDRWGILSVEARNLFDEHFLFQDTDPGNPSIFPKRTLFGKITLAF